MDGGSGLNLMYLNNFEGLGLTWDQLQSSPHSFSGVVPGKQFVPLGWVNLLVTFRDASNYRTKMLAFEVVDFSGPYHVILGQSCYIKFMAITSFTYLKLKIPKSAGLITVEDKTQQALDCEQNNIELATAAVIAAELRELCLRVPPTSTSLTMPPSFDAFKAVDDPAKTVQIRVGLNPK
jgi:hypothetical protein